MVWYVWNVKVILSFEVESQFLSNHFDEKKGFFFHMYYKNTQEFAFIFFQVVGLTMAIVLLWHRITWGFAEWIHEAWFYNFWNGTYVVIACKCTQCGNLAIFLPLRFYKEKLSNFHTVK